MKKTVLSIMAAALVVMISGCTDDNTQALKEKVTYTYTTSEVYQQMCANCHGQKAQGNAEPNKHGKPKGPPLNTLKLYELKLALTDIKDGGLNQSSGTDHEVMGHNNKAIVKKGMDYDTDAMAEYIYNNFNVAQ